MGAAIRSIHHRWCGGRGRISRRHPLGTRCSSGWASPPRAVQRCWCRGHQSDLRKMSLLAPFFMGGHARHLHLLTFVPAFESDRFYRRTAFAIAGGAPGSHRLRSPNFIHWTVAAVATGGLSDRIVRHVHVLCQGELARSRPAPRYLTMFYLTIAAGGRHRRRALWPPLLRVSSMNSAYIRLSCRLLFCSDSSAGCGPVRCDNGPATISPQCVCR